MNEYRTQSLFLNTISFGSRMNCILFDDEKRQSLLPLTYTRPLAELRVGILTIREKWEKHLNTPCSHLTAEYLQKKFPLVPSDDNLLINAGVLPNPELVTQILSLQPNTKLMKEGVVVAIRSKGKTLLEGMNYHSIETVSSVVTVAPMRRLEYAWDIFSFNGEEMSLDFSMLTKGRKSGTLSSTNRVIRPENIFVEEGARVECSILNASEGIIYIGKNAEVMEGAMIRGPFALMEGAQVKMGTRIYGPTTIGPYSRVGGEISHSMIQGFSNKAHDGFLGNSVVGEWCNLGADTNNSNLKNNYSQVKVWNYQEERFVNSKLQFVGLIMGDHSKCSINTMFNTGTVVGVSANIFGTGFPPKFIPSFSWGGSDGFATYRIEEAIEVAQRVYERRKIEFDKRDEAIMQYLFENTTKYRAW